MKNWQATPSAISARIAPQILTGRQSYHLDVQGPANGIALSVVSFEGVERMGEPYRFSIELTHPAHLQRADYLGCDATFTIDAADGVESRTFCGCITRFSKLKTTADFSSYRIAVEAHIARLGLTRTSRIYQHQSAPQIIEAILRRHGFKGHQFQFKLRRAYPQHAFRFQHQMADWSYIRMLMEQEGIYSYFEAGKHGDVLVFADDVDHYAYQPELNVPYRETAGLEAGIEAIFALQTHTETVPESFLVADYNPAQAWERIKADANIARGDTTTYGQPYVYGTHHLDQDGAKWEAQLRHEAAIARQVVYEGQGNVLKLRPGRVLHLDVDQLDAPNGQVVIEVTHSGARDAAYRNKYRAIPADRRFRLPVEEAAWPKINGTLSARVTSPGQYKYAYLTQQGHYVVRFDCDFDEWNPGGESVPLRLAKPFAGGLQTGFHFPALDGTEAVIAFRDGNPNKPYISQFHHNSQQTDLITNQDRWLSRNVIRTQSDNKLQMEDWAGEEHVKLSTEHSGKSQLTLGHMVNGLREKRGEGFELRTSGWGAIRGGKGLFISADDQPRANGQQLDMTAATAQLQLANAQAEGLAAMARIAKAETADLKAENQWLKESVNELKQAVMVLSAPAGVAISTPDRVSVAVGKDVNVAANAGFHVNTLKNIALAARDTLSLFAHKLGIKLFAARGKVRIQAQSDAMELVSQKNMQIASADGTVTVNAANGVVLNGGGSAYIKVLGDNVEIGGAGNLIVKVPKIQKTGPGALSLPLPKFDQGSIQNDERFILSDGITGRPVANRPYKIQLASGQVVEGITNDQGETALNLQDVAQGLKLLLKN